MAKGNEQIETGTLTPGTLFHLEQLALLDSGPWANYELADFLAATQATRSLGFFIKILRTYRPLQIPYIDLDNRLVVNGKLIYRFTGSIYRDSNDPRLSHLSLCGEKRGENGIEELAYGALIPINLDLTHDPLRKTQAYSRLVENDGQKKIVHRLAYNEAAFPEYNEQDSRVPINVISLAAQDLISLLGYTPGEISKPAELKPLAEGYVRFNPGYLDDDPDEFLNVA